MLVGAPLLPLPLPPAAGLTYSWRAPTPVKLVPYKDVEYKSEYQDGYCKTKKPFPGSTLRRAPQAQQPAR